MTTSNQILPSSFRDPSGFVFLRDGSLYRQVNPVYRDNYDHLMGSGLYEALVGSCLLVEHSEEELGISESRDAYRVLRPEPIPFISYPYEWCFSELRDAALATLRIAEIALRHGMILKDSSAFNIQFHHGKPAFIDTLSFEKYVEGRPWVAYRQFCQHFLAPLALMSKRDVRLSQLFRIHLDGIPLDLTSSLLPLRTCFGFSLAAHIHLHAKTQKRYAGKVPRSNGLRMSRRSLLGLMDSLRQAVRRLTWKPAGTEWADYYDDTNYSSEAENQKRRLVARFLDLTKPRVVWDLGANNGAYSRLASDNGSLTIAFDVDPAAVEANYLEVIRRGERDILPLVMDLTNPSSDIGWEHRERMSLAQRGPADTVLALALIHHLAISNNVPLPRLARFFSRLSRQLIIEFVPKTDSQVQRLLATREDVFPEYTPEGFEDSFGQCFTIEQVARIQDSQRSLYLMRRR